MEISSGQKLDIQCLMRFSLLPSPFFIFTEVRVSGFKMPFGICKYHLEFKRKINFLALYLFVLPLKGGCGLRNISQMDIDQLTSYFVLNKSQISNRSKCSLKLPWSVKYWDLRISSKGWLPFLILSVLKYNSSFDSFSWLQKTFWNIYIFKSLSFFSNEPRRSSVTCLLWHLGCVCVCARVHACMCVELYHSPQYFTCSLVLVIFIFVGLVSFILNIFFL